MANATVRRALASELWALADRQHGVVTREQLLARGFTSRAVQHRVSTGRLHPVGRGVYAVGRPELSRHGRWMAAVMSCGSEAVLSHASAAALWGLRDRTVSSRANATALWELRDGAGGLVDVTVPPHVRRRRPGVRLHRHPLDPEDSTTKEGVPVTSVDRTLLDLSTTIDRRRLEAAINEADKLDLTDPDGLRAALDRYAGRPGVTNLRAVLDRQTFALTDSELERRFLPIARRAGLPLPETGVELNGFKVDFYWRELGLVVETDGLRYHRTAAQQARDRLRDQAHTAAGLTPLRFTYAQVRYEPRYVQAMLASVARRLAAAPAPR
jgi:very-short-patch-repair endonuclease/predicted transcriptional regulator of viral defense system